MHLWPSMRIRDSFKIGYLKKLEWNLHRMNSEKRSQPASGNSNRQRLLDNHHDSEQKHGVVSGGIREEKAVSATPSYSSSEKAPSICREILMILSCCYCCFCCGVCVEDDL
uniref:Uncharacterized protein LOC105650901 n=1 Tax=Rhizophora mucronata TaxID=61149 RepID=A0A2P2JRE3_RHIMU